MIMKQIRPALKFQENYEMEMICQPVKQKAKKFN